MFSNCGAELEDSLPCGALILNTVFDLNLTNVIVETALAMDYWDLACLAIHLSQIQFSDKTATQDCIGGNTSICYGSCLR